MLLFYLKLLPNELKSGAQQATKWRPTSYKSGAQYVTLEVLLPNYFDLSFWWNSFLSFILLYSHLTPQI